MHEAVRILLNKYILLAGVGWGWRAGYGLCPGPPSAHALFPEESLCTAPLGLRGAQEGLETPALRAHSRPQALRLQRRPSSRTPSQPPSRPGAGRQVRVRVCSPPPQSRVHSPHRDHSFQPPVEKSGGGPRGQGPGSGLPGGEEPQGRAEYDSETSLGL